MPLTLTGASPPTREPEDTSRASHTAHGGACRHDPCMRRRVLVIDDNTAFRVAVGRVLASDGFVVVAGAATGASGVQLAREHEPDLVIVDVQLPDTDGFAVAERLARLDPALQVILTSSLDSSDLGGLVTESPACGFIPKAELSARAIAALLAPAP